LRAPLGLVADVVRFSWLDGPGNRFVIFLQGCNFDCVACHNPHTIPRQSVQARPRTVESLIAEIAPLAPFLAGVTVSGGEATLQAPFVAALFAQLGSELPGLTRFIDSNGAADAATWDALLPVTDGVMLDLKAFDPSVHRWLTGSPNDQVLAAIRQVSAAGKLHEVRLLLVPGVNDDAATLQRTVHWLLGVDPAQRIKVIRFRRHGVRAAGRQWSEADDDGAANYRELISACGVRELEVI